MRVHTDPRDVVAENWARACWLQAHPDQPVLLGVLGVEVEVFVPLPAAAVRAERGRWVEWRVACGLRLVMASGKPDADNIAKLYLDGLNGVAWVDDSQIADLRVRKFYAEDEGSVGVLLRVWELAEPVRRPDR